MDGIQLFLHQHAMVHSAEMSGDIDWSFEDSVLEGLTGEQMKLRPAAWTNSIAWLIWHIARTEDVSMNLLVAGQAQVLAEDGWLDRLKMARRDIGTAMTDEEVARFSETADIATIRAYRVAVGRRTREIVRDLSWEDLQQPVDPAGIETLLSEGALAGRAGRLARFWSGRSKAFMLGMPATGHAFAHLGEATSIRKQLGL